MTAKACCLKVKGCLGMAKDTPYGSSNLNAINGVESGILPIVDSDSLTDKQETELGSLLDEVVAKHLVSSDKGLESLKNLMDFGVQLAG